MKSHTNTKAPLASLLFKASGATILVLTGMLTGHAQEPDDSVPRQPEPKVIDLTGLPQNPALSRAAEIDAARQTKSGMVKPEINSRPESTLIKIREEKILERITGGTSGWRIKIGGLAPLGGFAVGPEYLRDDLKNGQISLRVAAQASVRRFQRYEVDFTLPKLFKDKAFFNVYGVRHDYPQLQYYGPGPESFKTGRSNYRLEDTALDATFGVRPLPKLTLAGQIGYVWNNVGPGTDKRFVSTEKAFTPAQAVGIDTQTDFLRTGAYAQYDYRDNPGGPRRGGYYLFQFSRYNDRKLNRHDFDRIDLEVQQYIPLFNERRVIALRGRTSLTDTSRGNSVPFYMQPTVGGPDSVRGYRAYRFYGNNSLVLNAEYRYEIFSGLDMAIFADAGKVTDRRNQINFSNLESSVGFGFRFNVRNNVFMRVETAFSHEGFQVWVRFNPVFRVGAARTSSSQGEF